MTITTTGLTQAAGIAAAVAGTIFVLVQINHPAMEVASVDTTEWVVRSTAKAVMAALALAGITGMYLRQVPPDRACSASSATCCSAPATSSCSASSSSPPFVLPDRWPTPRPATSTTSSSPPRRARRRATSARCTTVFAVTGRRLRARRPRLRHRAVPRRRPRPLGRRPARRRQPLHAALAVLPDSFNRPLAVPTGVALIGLGVSLWRDQRRAVVRRTPRPQPPPMRAPQAAVR